MIIDENKIYSIWERVVCSCILDGVTWNIFSGVSPRPCLLVTPVTIAVGLISNVHNWTSFNLSSQKVVVSLFECFCSFISLVWRQSSLNEALVWALLGIDLGITSTKSVHLSNSYFLTKRWMNTTSYTVFCWETSTTDCRVWHCWWNPECLWAVFKKLRELREYALKMLLISALDCKFLSGLLPVIVMHLST